MSTEKEFKILLIEDEDFYVKEVKNLVENIELLTIDNSKCTNHLQNIPTHYFDQYKDNDEELVSKIKNMIIAISPDMIILDLAWSKTDYTTLSVLFSAKNISSNLNNENRPPVFNLIDEILSNKITLIKNTKIDQIPIIIWTKYSKSMLAIFNTHYKNKINYIVLQKDANLKDLKNKIEECFYFIEVLRKEELYFFQPTTDNINLIAQVWRSAKSNCNILITGESGSGKEIVANLIHNNSRRKNKKFKAVNCAYFDEQRAVSEIFGHEKGAFTDASNRHIGLVEVADGGTLFLDEIGDLKKGVQSKLFRFLDDGKFYRLGGTEELKSDIRIISATNKELSNSINRETFRKELLHRLSTLKFSLKPLRERKSEIKLFLELEIKKIKESDPFLAQLIKDRIHEFASEFDRLYNYSFPGNIRELQNIVAQYLIQQLPLEDILKSESSNYGEGGLIKELYKYVISKDIDFRKVFETLKYKVMLEAKNNFSVQKEAAERLKISPKEFSRLLKELENKDNGNGDML